MVRRRLAHIDGLRAIAVLAVAVFHARVHVLGADLEPWAKNGAHGVDLFFVLSGFCLAYPTLEKIRANGSARFDAIGYALKRFLRIYPPYAIVLVAYAIVAAVATARGYPLPGGLNDLGSAGIFDNLAFLDKGHTYVDDSFWSLAIEFRWYFAFPFALLLAVKSPRALVAAIALVAIAGEFTRAGSVDVGVLPAFLLGIVAAAIDPQHRFVRYAVPLAIGSFACAVVDDLRPHFPLNTNAGWHAVAFFFVLAAGHHAWLRRLLSWRPLTAVGVASYSIYLVHEPIVSALAVGLRPALGDAAAAAIGIAAGVVAGFAVWAVVERPLTQPQFVTRFVSGGRTRAAQLFAFAGISGTFDLIAGPSMQPIPAAGANVTPFVHGLRTQPLEEKAV